MSSIALPWVQGALHPAWTFLWRLPDGSLKDFTGLTTSNFSLVLHPLNSNTSDIVGGGVFGLVNGVLVYQPVANDVATPGNYQLIITATYPGGLPDKTQPYLFPIVAA